MRTKMSRNCLIFVLLLAALAVVGKVSGQSNLVDSVPCDQDACETPNCRCSSTSIPGGLLSRDTPQFIILTFDDAVNVINMETYRNVLYGRSNSNRCPSGVTFFVNHEYTNYQLVNELYNNGFEIALHSISHQTPQSYWIEATYEDMKREFADQRVQMSHFANIPMSEINGIRIPFLQMTGNHSFHVMLDYNITYDLTMPTISMVNPGLWPYTLDYRSTQDCVIPPCPTAAINGVWVNPMISWIDLNGTPCSMVDSCFWVPDHQDEEAWFRFIVTNFERHYLGNRAPFGFYIHEWYPRSYPAVMRALERFLDMVNNLDDAFMVNAIEVIDFMKNPKTIDEYKNTACRTNTPTWCPQASCGPIRAEHNDLDYYLQLCSNSCPRVYPWLGNPLGE